MFINLFPKIVPFMR